MQVYIFHYAVCNIFQQIHIYNHHRFREVKNSLSYKHHNTSCEQLIANYTIIIIIWNISNLRSYYLQENTSDHELI